MERLSAYGGAHAANDDDRGGGVNLSTDERAFLSALGRDRALVTDRARMASVARALALGGDAPTRPRLHHHHHRGGARPSTAAAARSAPVTPARPSTSAGWYGDGNGNDDGNELSALSPLPRARKDFLRKGEGRRGDGGGTASASASARSSPAAAGGGSRSRRPATASANAARRSVEGSPLRPRSARAVTFAPGGGGGGGGGVRRSVERLSSTTTTTRRIEPPRAALRASSRRGLKFGGPGGGGGAGNGRRGHFDPRASWDSWDGGGSLRSSVDRDRERERDREETEKEKENDDRASPSPMKKSPLKSAMRRSPASSPAAPPPRSTSPTRPTRRVDAAAAAAAKDLADGGGGVGATTTRLSADERGFLLQLAKERALVSDRVRVAEALQTMSLSRAPPSDANPITRQPIKERGDSGATNRMTPEEIAMKWKDTERPHTASASTPLVRARWHPTGAKKTAAVTNSPPGGGSVAAPSTPSERGARPTTAPARGEGRRAHGARWDDPETDAAVIKQRSEASFRRMIERREDTLEAVAEAERRAIEVEEAAAAAVGEAEEELSLRPRSNSATPPGGNSPAPAPGPKHGRRAVGRRPAPAAAAEPASSSSPPPSVRDSTRAKAGKALAEWAFEEKWQWDWQQTLDAELSPGAAPLRASTVAETRTYRDRRIARRLARESIDAEAEDGSEKKSEIETETESASASAPPPAAEAPPSSTGAIVFDDDDVSEEELPPETSTAAAAAAAAAAEKDAEDDDDDAADIPTELSDSDGDGNDDDLFTKIIRSGGTPDKRPRRPWPEHRTSPLPLRVVDVDAIREVESLPAV